MFNNWTLSVGRMLWKKKRLFTFKIINLMIMKLSKWNDWLTCVLVVSPLMQSPKANILSNLECYKVKGFTSTRPVSSVIPESTSSLCGTLFGLMQVWLKGCWMTSPLSTFLNVAIFSPIDVFSTLINSHPKNTSTPLLWHSSRATSFAYPNL